MRRLCEHVNIAGRFGGCLQMQCNEDEKTLHLYYGRFGVRDVHMFTEGVISKKLMGKKGGDRTPRPSLRQKKEKNGAIYTQFWGVLGEYVIVVNFSIKNKDVKCNALRPIMAGYGFFRRFCEHRDLRALRDVHMFTKFRS